MVSNNAECVETNAGHRRLLALASAIVDISSGFVEPVDLDGAIHYALERLFSECNRVRAW